VRPVKTSIAGIGWFCRQLSGPLVPGCREWASIFGVDDLTRFGADWVVDAARQSQCAFRHDSLAQGDLFGTKVLLPNKRAGNFHGPRAPCGIASILVKSC
jgi:hypothetical protein